MTRADQRAASLETVGSRLAVALGAIWLALAFVLASLVPAQGGAPGNGPVLHVFWSVDCPVCIRQKPWLEGLEARFPGLRVEEMELSRTDRHHARFAEMAAARGVGATHVPTLMLGPRAWVGDTPGQRAEIEAVITAMLAGDAALPAPGDGLRLPLLGEVDRAAASVLGLTVLIAFVDGFNPCSLWVLTLLLGMVIASGSRRRMAVVGISFLLSTALIYGGFIAGLFSVLAFAFALPWVR